MLRQGGFLKVIEALHGQGKMLRPSFSAAGPMGSSAARRSGKVGNFMRGAPHYLWRLGDW
jgi:hypothetical protein